MTAGTNIDEIRTPGKYYSASTGRTASLNGSIPTNLGFGLIVLSQNGGVSRSKQIIHPATTTSTPIEFQRVYTGSGWTSWFRVQMTEVV